MWLWSLCVIVLLLGGRSALALAPEEDFAARCSAPGVLVCRGFDSTDAQWSKEALAGTSTTPAFDAAVHASGGGSLRFDVPGESGANAAGTYNIIFSRGFGPHSTLYIQWRQRFNQTMALTGWSNLVGSTFKQLVTFWAGAPSCQAVSVVFDNLLYNDIPGGYAWCGNRGLTTTLDGTQHTDNTPFLLQQGDYQCQYGQRPYPAPPCLRYTPDVWTTFYATLTIGDWNQPNSMVEAWAALDGNPLKQYLRVPKVALPCNQPPTCAPGEAFSALYIGPYMTNKNAAVDHPLAQTWYDELIVSDQPIAAPLANGGGMVANQPPPVPSTTPPPPPPVPTATVPLAPTNLTSTCGVEGTSATLQWAASAGATGYLLRVDNPLNNVSTCQDGWFCDGSDKMVNNLTTTQYIVPVIPGRTYNWWVHGVNILGHSPAAIGTILCQAPPSGPWTPPSTVGWSEIPHTRLDSVQPCPANNCPWSGPNGFAAFLLAWNGAAPTADKLYMMGGGHKGYFGNELYIFDLATWTMVRLTEPSNPPSDTPLTECTAETAEHGTKPVARQIYDGLVYITHANKLWLFSGANIPCGQTSPWTWIYDLGTKTWRQRGGSGDINTYPWGSVGIAATYDPQTKLIYFVNTECLWSYNADTDTYAKVMCPRGNGASGYMVTSVIDPGRRVFVLVDATPVYAHTRVFHLPDGAVTDLPLPSSAGVRDYYTGLTYDPITKRVLAWNGGDTLAWLDVEGQKWVPFTVPGGPAANPQGTYKRLFYDAKDDLFVVVNDVNVNAYALRLPREATTQRPQGKPTITLQPRRMP